MATKYVRGQLLVFTSAPIDATGAAIAPSTIKLYLNYIHANGITSTDTGIDMDEQSDGTYIAEFDTGNVRPGPVFASIRAENPTAAADLKFTITANAANPLDTP